MKKMQFLLLILLSLGTLFTLSAQVDITFQVDMTGQTVSANGVHMAGDFLTPAWTPPATPLYDDGTNGDAVAGDNVWSVIVTGITAASGEFKFLTDNDWSCGCDESSNRPVTFPTTNATTGVIPWNGMPTVNVTLQVDVSAEAVSANGVHVAGDIITPNWDPPATPLADQGGGIWSVTIPVTAGQGGAYKFLTDNDWGCNCAESISGSCAAPGSDNRNFDPVSLFDVTIDPVVYGACPDTGCTDPTIDLVFQLDARCAQIGAAGPHMAGSFLDPAWTPDATPMFDDGTNGDAVAGDGIYAVTISVDLCNGSSGEYKFLLDDFWGSDESVGGLPCDAGGFGNRSIDFPAESGTVEAVCFGECGPCAAADLLSDVTFRVSTLSSVGSMFLAGSFGDLDASLPTWDPMGLAMNEVEGSNGQCWELTLEDLPSCLALEYKFVIDGTGWESTPNRSLNIPGEDTVLPSFCYESLEPCPTDVLFQVDMNETTVDPAGVGVEGGFSNGLPTWGTWNPMYDDGTNGDLVAGDGIWSVLLAEMESQSGVEYKFTNGIGGYEPVNGPGTFGNRILDLGCSTGGFVILDPVGFGSLSKLPSISVTFVVDASGVNVDAFGLFVGGSNLSSGEQFSQQMGLDLNGCFYSATVLLIEGDDYAYNFFNGTAIEVSSVRNITVGSSNEELPLATFGADELAPCAPLIDLTRAGSLIATSNFEINGNELYSWYLDGSPAAALVGINAYYPTAVGEWSVVISDPDFPCCDQQSNPRVVEDLTGCCELGDE